MAIAVVSERAEQTSGRGAHAPRGLVAALALLCAVLAFRLGYFLAAAAQVIRFPYGLDYGEGVVWQHLLLIARGDGYGDIDTFPYVVFQYPPVYHVLTWTIATLAGLDPLMAGRLLSTLATLATGALVGAIVFRALRGEVDTRAAAATAMIGAMLVFTLQPIGAWASFMRVDMLAIALGLLGVLLGLRAVERPAWVHAAALCFVLAAFTKQTAVSAAFATFALLLVARPRVAARGILTGVVAGLIPLAVLAWSTDGGFLRHLVLYNINRFDLRVLVIVTLAMAGFHMVYLGMAAIVARHEWQRLRSGRSRGGTTTLRDRLLASERDRVAFLMLVQGALTTLTLVTAGKSGANVNYFIEWLCVACVLVGLYLRDAVAAATRRRDPRTPPGTTPLLVTQLLLVLVQAVVLPPPVVPRIPAERMREWHDLVERVRAADAPVVSDDAALLLRAGKEVPWEPSTFAELATLGRWDERPLVRMIERREFAFFVTTGRAGDRFFHDRFTPAVARALEAAYPRKEERAGFVLHLPAK